MCLSSCGWQRAPGVSSRRGAPQSRRLVCPGVPRLRVVAPATVDDARKMLAQALVDPDPVVMFEHATLYASKGEVDDDPIDLDTARVLRPGDSISIITYGGCVPKVLSAADRLAEDGIDAEVVDLRTLRPLDTATLAESVTRTRRASSSRKDGAAAACPPKSSPASTRCSSTICSPRSAEWRLPRCRFPTPSASRRPPSPGRRRRGTRFGW